MCVCIHTHTHTHTHIYIMGIYIWYTICCCCSSVVQSCPTLCNPMDCSTPGFPVLHHLPELAQTHIHWVGAVMPSTHLIFCRPLLLLPSIFSSIRGWRRKWQPAPVLMPGQSHGWRSLVGCRLWGRTESDTIEVT